MAALGRHWQSSSWCHLYFTVANKPIWLLTVCIETYRGGSSSWSYPKTADCLPSLDLRVAPVPGCGFISGVPFTFTVGWFLVRHWQDQRWEYILMLEFLPFPFPLSPNCHTQTSPTSQIRCIGTNYTYPTYLPTSLSLINTLLTHMLPSSNI